MTSSPVGAARWREFLLVGAVLLAVKLVGLCLDPTARLFFGDSASYLHSALTGWIPPDRSFVYGLFLRGTLLAAHSMLALLIVQSLFGVGTALLLFAILRCVFDASLRLALVFALLLAIEPAQLFYERMMMAESAGTLALAAMLGAGFAWVRRPHWAWTLLWPLAGICCVALRMSSLPVVLGFAMLPVLVRLLTDPPLRVACRRYVPHLLLALLATGVLHVGYKHLYGRLAGVRPDYVGDTGAFRLGLVAPLVTRDDVVAVGLPPDLLDHLGPPLEDPRAREAQIWQPDGLIARIRDASPDSARLMRKLSGRAVHQHPGGFLRLGASTLADYFDAGVAVPRLEDDMGNRAASQGMLDDLQACCGFDARGFESVRNPVTQYFVASRFWLTACYLGLLPLAWIMFALQWSRARGPALLLALTATGLFFSTLLFSHIVSFRYLHPFPLLLLLCAGAMLAAVAARRRVSAPPPPP